MSKTVYILGAGFSKSAGAPSQSEIIDEIFRLIPSDIIDISYRDLFFEYRTELSNLLIEVFCLIPEKFKDFSLEDIYSTIDRCILNNYSLGKYGRKGLIDLRDKINALIIMLMDQKLIGSFHNADHINDFAGYLIDKRIEGYKKDVDDDPFAIISTNWDIIFENSIQARLILTECHNMKYKMVF